MGEMSGYISSSRNCSETWPDSYCIGDQTELCTCLNWKDAYEERVECGEAWELATFTNSSEWDFFDLFWYSQSPDSEGITHYQQTCWYVFSKMDHNRCVLMDILRPHTGTWCYVDSRCRRLNGGRRVEDKLSSWGTRIPRDVSWKRFTSSRRRRAYLQA